MLMDDQNNQLTVAKISTPNNIVSWKQYLKIGFADLKADFLSKPNSTRLFKNHCKLIDRMLVSIWEQMGIDDRCCLIAVGGYGRGELYPYSDIDLLILIPDSDDQHTNSSINESIEKLVGLLWDIGLNVGHSVRSLSECISEARKDITVHTNLIEARLLTGKKNAYQTFLSGVKDTLNSPAKVSSFF